MTNRMWLTSKPLIQNDLGDLSTGPVGNFVNNLFSDRAKRLICLES